MRGKIVIEVNDLCRVRYEEGSYLPEILIPGGIDVIDPHYGTVIKSKPKWKSYRKWYETLSEALLFLSEQVIVNNHQDSVSIYDWAREMRSIEALYASQLSISE